MENLTIASGLLTAHEGEFRDYVFVVHAGSANVIVSIVVEVTDPQRLRWCNTDDPLRKLCDAVEQRIVATANWDVTPELEEVATGYGLRLDRLFVLNPESLLGRRGAGDALGMRESHASHDSAVRTVTRRSASRRIAFRVLWPSTLPPATPAPLFAYISTDAAGAKAVAADVAKQATLPEDWRSAIASRLTREPLDIVTVLPLVGGVEFTPPALALKNVASWARADFAMRAAREGTCSGSVQFFAGPVLIGEVAISVRVTSEGRATLKDAKAQAYRNIFVSYSHEDGVIVDRLAQAYRVLGDQYLRDVDILRSGEQWNAALLSKIDKADIFQLCWSAAAKRSQFVEQEWRHALALQRDRFIRPVYWRKPLPDPPPELAPLHFAFLDL